MPNLCQLTCFNAPVTLYGDTSSLVRIIVSSRFTQDYACSWANLSSTLYVNPRHVCMEYVYLRRWQEKVLMQKTRRLMDDNGVSFQMLLIQLSFSAVRSESQISVD